MRGRLYSLGDLGSDDAAMTFPTEAERQARLHKRAGCCTEEEAMTDPTPEERAQTAMDGMFDLGTIQFSIADQIRAAVEAERERIAVLCDTSGLVNGNHFAATIRARGESE
jgi:hypothetical protein